jgi:hypothetical protein
LAVGVHDRQLFRVAEVVSRGLGLETGLSDTGSGKATIIGRSDLLVGVGRRGREIAGGRKTDLGVT